MAGFVMTIQMLETSWVDISNTATVVLDPKVGNTAATTHKMIPIINQLKSHVS